MKIQHSNNNNKIYKNKIFKNNNKIKINKMKNKM